MERSQAIKVLYEVHDACRGLFVATCVSLDRPSSHISKTIGGYQIKIMCDIDSQTMKCFQPILDKHGLKLKEESGFVVIYTA